VDPRILSRVGIIERIPGAWWLWRLWCLRTKMKLFLLGAICGRKYHQVVFTDIFVKDRWGDIESRSGPGSSLHQTSFIRDELANLLEDRGVRHLLDIPCGDFHWMKEVRLPSGLIYIGGEIVEAMVNQNNGRYSNNIISFRKLNLLSDQLPKSDLVLCRDCFVHFSFSDIFGAIRNIKMSGSACLLTTHFTGDRKNHDIRTGEWRPISLTSPPFNFPPPVLIINERSTEWHGQLADKSLGLWKLEDLPG
jgi:hypothetical protein